MKKHSAHFGYGVSLILLIFVTLCLVALCVLSFITARADSRLSSEIEERTSAYWTASNLATEKLAKIDSVLADVFASSASEEAYRSAVLLRFNSSGEDSGKSADAASGGSPDADSGGNPGADIDTAEDGVTAVQNADGSLQLSFKETMTDTSELEISVKVLTPDTVNPWYYEISGWRTVNTSQWNPDTEMPLLGDTSS
ncbi:MAG TPA: hypothetical protein PLN48_03255 [Lachnospiraceae bacterium]|nr:hypothetical protein [Lachnospiraceae bacterium]